MLWSLWKPNERHSSNSRPYQEQSLLGRTTTLLENAPSRWAPSLAIKFTLWLHGGFVLGVVVWPAVWLWLLAAVIGNHLLLAMFGKFSVGGESVEASSRLRQLCRSHL
jgi:hypothetical protein